MDLQAIADGAVIPTAVATAACALGNLRAATSALRAPRLGDQPPQMPPGEPWPLVSVIVPACNEEHTIERAVATLRASDYPALEITLVDDRSSDGTGSVIDRIAAADPRVRAVHLDELPPGWLGKVHALHRGAEMARGELLLFCDADVRFAPDALRRAVGWMARDRLDHLTLLPRMHGSLALSAAHAAFATGFLMAVDTPAIGRPGSKACAGVGAFGLVRRSSFAATAGFPWLRLEIADDMGLAVLMVREGGGRSRLGTAGGLLELEWYDSVGALVRGLEKNLFAVIGRYSAPRAILALVGALAIGTSGWVAIALGLALGRPFLIVLAALAWLTQGLVALAYHRSMSLSVGATLLAPFLLYVVLFALARSTWVTLRRGGVQWRGTFYPIDALRKGRRVDV